MTFLKNTANKFRDTPRLGIGEGGGVLHANFSHLAIFSQREIGVHSPSPISLREKLASQTSPISLN